MKITKRQLRRIIREEKDKLLREAGTKPGHSPRQHSGGGKPRPGEVDRKIREINGLVDDLLRAGIDPDELQSKMQSITDSITDLDEFQPGYRTPTEEESGIPDSRRSVVHNRRPDW